MHKPTSIFVATLVLFAAGTSAIGYSLASETYNASKPIQAAFTLIDMSNIPWYCVSTKSPIKGQAVDDRSGYYPSGYYQDDSRRAPPSPSGYIPSRTPPPPAGYYPPASRNEPTKPGYTPPAPGYKAPPPGYKPAKPGYQPPGKPGYMKPPPGYQIPNPGYQEIPPAPRGYDGGILPAQLQPKAFNPNWQKSLTPCPTGYKFDEALIVSKCSATLQKKLNGNPLPAESKEQYYTCEKILASTVWSTKISQKICSAFYLYENDCMKSQKSKKACQPLSKYLTTAGVSKKDIPKTQSDSIYLCKDVYPKP